MVSETTTTTPLISLVRQRHEILCYPQLKTRCLNTGLPQALQSLYPSHPTLSHPSVDVPLSPPSPRTGVG